VVLLLSCEQMFGTEAKKKHDKGCAAKQREGERGKVARGSKIGTVHAPTRQNAREQPAAIGAPFQHHGAVAERRRAATAASGLSVAQFKGEPVRPEPARLLRIATITIVARRRGAARRR
jgi:hypothetical protein